MFAYCGNNAVKYEDHSGYVHRDSNAVFNYTEYEKAYGGRVSVHPSGMRVEYSYPSGTISICLCTTVAGGPSVSTAQGITMDWEGNIGHIKTVGLGAGFPTVGAALVITFTDAENIYLQRGWGGTVGGSINVAGLSAGYDHSFFKDSTSDISYQGHSLVSGIDASYPLEFHGGATYSIVEG